MRSRRRKIFEKRNKSTTNCFFSSIKFEPCIFLKTNLIFIHVSIIKITIEAVEKRMQKAEKRKKQTIAWETINVDSLRFVLSRRRCTSYVYRARLRNRISDFSIRYFITWIYLVSCTPFGRMLRRSAVLLVFVGQADSSNNDSLAFGQEQRMPRNSPALNIIRVIFRFSQLDGTVILVPMGGGL